MKRLLREHSLFAGVLAGVGTLAATPTVAGDLSGRLELTFGDVTHAADSLSASLGPAQYLDLTGDARLMWRHSIENFDVEIHYKMAVQNGEGVAISSAVAAGSPPPPPYTMFDLTHTDRPNADTSVTHTVDRLSVAYTTPDFVIRVGRQALTWGAGTVFHPLDLVAPFSPSATDTEFKPGVDMIYTQWLMQDGSDLEFVVVPRRATAGGSATMDASTIATRYRTSIGDFGLTAVLAQDHGDTTAGLGLSGPLGGAVWNAEIVPTRLDSGETVTSGLANISFGTQLAGKTTLLFAEYFHNGFGLTGNAIGLDALPADLSDRISRGQVYSVSQDYLALGLSMEWSPLVSVSATGILNLNDDSYLASAEANISLTDNANLAIGAQVPGGGNGTEFGGLPASGSGAPFVGPEQRLYVNYRQYF